MTSAEETEDWKCVPVTFLTTKHFAALICLLTDVQTYGNSQVIDPIHI